ncbi:TPA: RS21-C6 protein [Candidatus Collierbacteria bacterium]|uniref:MazG nucleotide pyrophosphohydrolase n=1 Tax=Candidatus Collierbacteria bacterium GW2011_GWB2_44_22 TaxID=1618387 RepID=A0A0G1HWM4_9BACT|nr:MAG: MazG nucleotide pyrophosphohydrolase [Candidatus Collierbacteria bacterium GW2011_GWA2_44_13]KKT51250.1 MAG: MazG nucleotide pyrophosphohydrolase [Candidatus Collierbacteria bacterium GW2011_GWB1_44_197]KKT51330.1 MAG: MazG nucleotide pyrophosphohydrolase [Candidatus Collierbacteria bacterium GW2011_GWB2_44_22]KKT61822.1 MAG: MazG nucleotide pyrophosphohydrolase [Candidatus Collierbacteria bacterium GW2011_GWD1_44_27]KKT66546.1 MAG: MazG nucleotide pyrophosphohydrolase [Candidatus Colli
MKKLQEYIAKMNKERGFEDTTIPELFMYLSEEVGEMAKAARQATKMHTDSASEKFELAHEMADVLSYLLDIANRFDIDLEKSFWEKEEINKQRVWNKKGE